MYKKYLKDNTCFIVPSSIKREILLYISLNKIFLDISFYTIEELKKHVFFDYDEKTVYSLCKEYDLKHDDALLLINNMYYINSDKHIDNIKISKLKEMKDFLDKQELLYYNENFLSYINNKNIVTIYDKTSFINEMIFNKLNNVIYISNEIKQKKDVYEFSFIEDEVEYVAHNIATLISNGTDINKIKLVNVAKEYINIVQKIFSFYGLPIKLNKKVSMYDLKIVKIFIEFLKENSVKDSLNLFKEKYDLNIEENLNIYNKIIQVMNKYYFINDYKKDLDFIINGFKNSYIREYNFKNYIECLDVEEMFSNDNYYFFIGFNSYFPKFYKDEDYLSDDLKVNLGFCASTEINKNIKRFYIDKIKSTNNLTITYKLKDFFNSYLVSSLIDDISEKAIKNPKFNNKISYSNKFDQIKLTKYLDEFYKFSYKNDNLADLYNKYGTDRYDSYDNSFTGIDNNQYMSIKNNKLNLSYSSLDEFYKCSFRYYLNNLLNETSDTFAIFIGNVYHEVLSKIYDSNFDFEKIYSESIAHRELNDKEEVLLIKLKEELKQNIVLLQEQLKNSDFKRTVCEDKIEIKIKSKASVILKGFIDKIMISKDNKYAYVVDYKTGKPKIDFDNLKDGLNMQLAIYMYLMNKSKDYADVFLVGCYLQKILDDDVTKDELKLEGYTYNDLNTIKLIDNCYSNKSFISGIKVKKDGSLTDNKKLFDTDYYNEVINIVEQKIEEAINSITNADFKINPKIVKGENVSCRFCNYKDICYKKYKDSIIISQAGDDDE